MRASTSGFSLIELLIVVAVVGILAVLVTQMSDNNSKKTRRAVAKSVLMDIQTQQARYQVNQHKYASLTDLSYSNPLYINANGDSVVQAKAYYQITITKPTDFTYSIKAQPINAQAGDSCGSLSIDQQGSKTAAENNCW